MEIIVDNQKIVQKKEFKIDLIVWKLAWNRQVVVFEQQFKIDLIVWKC